MPQQKPLLSIPVDFIEKVMNLIAGESQAELDLFVSIANEAAKEYKKPTESYSWGYWFKRERSPKIEKKVKEIEKKVKEMQEDTSDKLDACKRIEKFKELIIEDNWETTSYNVSLFKGIIAAIPGYAPLEDKLVMPFIEKLRDELLLRISTFINEYNATKKLVEERNDERDLATKKAELRVQIFNNLDAAKIAAQDPEQKKTIFSLFKDKQGSWEFFLISSKGEAYPLLLTDELFRTLEDKNIHDISGLNDVFLKPIKVECVKAQAIFLDRTKLLINPIGTSTEELQEKGIQSTFMLHHTSVETKLLWVNSLNVAREINLNDYPEIKTWLTEHPLLDTDAKAQLKLYLLTVNTSKALSAEKMAVAPLISIRPVRKVGSLNLMDFSSVSKLLGARVGNNELPDIVKNSNQKANASVVLSDTATQPKPSIADAPILWKKKNTQAQHEKEEQAFSQMINN